MMDVYVIIYSMGAENSPVIDYLGIHDTFSEGEYGVILASNVRYEKYKPPETSNERWEELLGPDVNNLAHLADTYHLTCDFISHTEHHQPGLLTEHDVAVLKITAIGHDWGESIIADINYFDKTEADEIAEKQVFIENLSNFYSSDEEEITSLINEAVETVIFDRESRLGQIFNVIERIGYLRTGLRAAEHVREDTAPDCWENLEWLAASVMSSDHIPHLIRRSSELFAAQHFLLQRQADITAAIEASLEPAIFYSHEPEPRASERVQELQRTRVIWKAWCTR